MKIIREFPLNTSFGILSTEFNKRLDDIRPDMSVQVALPTQRSRDPNKEIFWLFWETNKLPAYPRKLLKTYRYIWAPSTWLSQILSHEGMDSRVLHLALDPSEWIPANHKHSTFRFLWVNEWIHRKGGDLLVSAFLDSFQAEDNVELVIKPNYTNQECSVRFPRVESIIDSCPGGPKEKIKVVNEFLPQKELAKLYASCDCYVYPFRTQGASLTLLEAQACGLPAIATRYAGCLDYAMSDCTYFVDPTDYRPVTRIDFFASYRTQDIGVEAVPDIKQLGELLRYCFEHPDEVRSRGLQASVAIKRSFSWEGLRSEAISALKLPTGKNRFRFWR